MARYRDNVKRLSALYNDRPQDPLELGIYWVEYVLRHKGAPHLRNVGRKLNILQYLSFDVILIYLSLIATSFYIIFTIIRLVCRKLFCGVSKKKQHLLASGKKTK